MHCARYEFECIFCVFVRLCLLYMCFYLSFFFWLTLVRSTLHFQLVSESVFKTLLEIQNVFICW